MSHQIDLKKAKESKAGVVIFDGECKRRGHKLLTHEANLTEIFYHVIASHADETMKRFSIIEEAVDYYNSL